MSISIGNSASLVSGTKDMAGVTVLRKALDMESQSAMTMINSIAQTTQATVSAANLPPNLGQNINTTA